jgi:hypothetical protein
MGYRTRPPSSTPSLKLGTPPQAKFVLRLARKRREIAFWLQQTNCTYYKGFSWGTAPDLLARPSPPNWGTAPKQNLYCDWLVNGEK